ncbi:phasin family protein [Chelatococcus sp. GCM10030263]|uniref:phasin family protein n=1 Tax=Chelatococcus sp. GCM10030263 TaxID=3273387 RepID=UPI00366D0187
MTETGLAQARQTFATVQEQREAWNRSLVASANATTKAATVINGKVLDLVRSQTDATLGLWRALLDVTSVAEAVELQTRELRRQYENTTTRVKDIAETASRLAQEATAPLAKGPTRPGA